MRRVRSLRHVGRHRTSVMRAGTVIGVMVLAIIVTPGITSTLSLRSMLLEASFLGLASFGQTLCVLIGGIDLSIAFVIDATNVGVLWLLTKHFSAADALLIMFAVTLVAGCLTGVLSYLLPGESVVISLGVGYVFVGVLEVLTSSGGSGSGAVFGQVPNWLGSLTSIGTHIFGVQLPPAIVIAGCASIVLSIWLRRSWHGRGVYAVAGNPVAARWLLVPTPLIWVMTFAISALLAGVVGVLLLGFSGGAVADVGNPYLFTTVAAVAVGGSALSGGSGGIGFTVIGVVTLTILTAVLVGSVLSEPMQQVVLGLVIIPAVAMYSRERRLEMQL